MSRSLPVRPGCAYSFLYPRYNYRGLPTRLESRRVIVEAMRDTRREPLEPLTVSSNPQLCRGRWLVSGYDLDRDATRSFYLDSMTAIQPLSRDQREPFRNAAYVVMTSVGRATFQASQLSDALDHVLQMPAGFVCRVVGRV